MEESVAPASSFNDESTVTAIFTLLQLTYGMPSLILMIFFLVFLRNYSNSFYRLVQLDLFVNILTFLNSWVAIRFQFTATGLAILSGLESTLPGVLTVSWELVHFFLHMQFCSTICLSLHRISSVKFQWHEKFWSKWYIPLGVLFAAYSLLPTVINGVSVHHFLENGTLWSSTNKVKAKKVTMTDAVAATTYFFLLLIVGIATALLVSRSVKVLALNKSDKGVGKKLTKIALTYCAIYTGILSWTVLFGLHSIFHFLPRSLLIYAFDILVFCSDMMTLALPYILLIFDTNVRRDVVFFNKPSGTDRMFVSTSGH